jgi:hypothetical protein
VILRTCLHVLLGSLFLVSLDAVRALLILYTCQHVLALSFNNVGEDAVRAV